ncbi:TetR/AcrR family transcriptional regulator [Granulicella sp. S190]|uniref:TetR/AcrR family transcriptional regulator n=1 Tax=Granulicella sp. S190 TaxID=1747226 RepID=UPI00131AE5DD|nr:TetR/AcrR family transcriptional regulator [Granulicella sp. S190]
MRRSRSEAAETRERIVSTAAGMFLRKGVEAVGMRDIMATAGLTPGGFYRHFESKEQLILEANSEAWQRLLAMFETQTDGKSSAEALETIVSVYLNQSQREGNNYLCPLAMIGAELSRCEAKVRAVSTAGYQQLVKLVADHLTHLGRDEAQTTASGLVSAMAGAVMLSNIASDEATARTILKNAHAMIRVQLSLGKKPSKKAVRAGR